MGGGGHTVSEESPEINHTDFAASTVGPSDAVQPLEIILFLNTSRTRGHPCS